MYQYIDTLIYALKINTCVEIVIYPVKNDVSSQFKVLVKKIPKAFPRRKHLSDMNDISWKLRKNKTVKKSHLVDVDQVYSATQTPVHLRFVAVALHGLLVVGHQLLNLGPGAHWVRRHDMSSRRAAPQPL